MTPEQESEILELLPRLRELVSGNDSTLHYHSLDRLDELASLTDIASRDHSLLTTILGLGEYHLTSGAATIAETLASGTYTPTSLGTSNLDSVTFSFPWFYLRLNDVVVMAGNFFANPTAAGLAYVDIDLPVSTASGTGSAVVIGGSYISASSSIAELIAGGAPVAGQLRINFTAVSTADNERWAIAMYRVT